jgi:uncharacterized protein (TIGR03083 family)
VRAVDGDRREPLVALLESVWDSITSLCRDLTYEEYGRSTDCPGWIVRDHLAHMIGTESMLLGRTAPEAAVDVRSLDHVRNDIGAFNEEWVQAYRSRPGADALADFEAVAAERLGMLAAMSPEEWDAEGFTPEGPGPYRAFMEIRLFDCWFHEQDMREALERPGGMVGAVADLAIGRIPRSLPYIIGKKAGVADGSIVAIEVEGAVFTVIVEGRARLAAGDEVVGEPNVRIALDRRTFARLAGGRWNAERARAHGSVVITGDATLGEQILANFGYTI